MRQLLRNYETETKKINSKKVQDYEERKNIEKTYRLESLFSEKVRKEIKAKSKMGSAFKNGGKKN